jgi:hypothetical protein
MEQGNNGRLKGIDGLQMVFPSFSGFISPHQQKYNHLVIGKKIVDIDRQFRDLSVKAPSSVENNIEVWAGLY